MGGAQLTRGRVPVASRVSGRRVALAMLSAIAVLSLAAAIPLTVLSGQIGDGVTAWAIGIRARYDADQTIATFAARLQDTVDLDSVRDDLAGVVQQALEPAHVSVWVSPRT